jgi:MFS family permease
VTNCDVVHRMGFSTSTTLALQSGSGALALVADFLCIAFIDRLGRRRPLIISNIVCSCSFVVAAALMASYGVGTKANMTNMAANRAFVATLWFFNFVFGLAIGPLAWAVPVEMFGSRYRGKATAITSSAQWISNCQYRLSPASFSRFLDRR